MKEKKILIENAGQVGFRFRQFRQSILKTQSELAESGMFSQKRILFIENGISLPSLEELSYLVDTYRLDLNWLVSGEGEMFVANIADKESNKETNETCQVFHEMIEDAHTDPGIKEGILLRYSELKRLKEFEETKSGNKSRKK